jgi:prepilin-type N-terminal cleavage/methylation domain-containing protein
VKRFAGFTLIELLIVVAIIAILAAIAVPNFLEAQTRAKISRVVSELRTLDTAMKTYQTDHNRYPVDYNADEETVNILPPGAEGDTSGIFHPGYAEPGGKVKAGLTTPISYITDCWMKDPFVGKNIQPGTLRFDFQVYTYNWFYPKLWGRTGASYYLSRGYADYYGGYRFGSIGPDRDWYNTPSGSSRTFVRASTPYDATNGTVSLGNIWRSEKETVVTGRPQQDRTTM